VNENSLPITPHKQTPAIQHDKNKHKIPDTNRQYLPAYIGKETLYITDVFKHASFKIAFRTNNTTENLF